MAFQVDDGVYDELAGSVKGCLPASEGLVEGGCAVGSRCGQVVDLVSGEISYFSPAAGVDGVELGCDYGRLWGRDGLGRGFVGEEVGDEGLL